MLDDYEQYEIECERIRESNGKLLADFEDWSVAFHKCCVLLIQIYPG
jgi:hypothetical protein